MTARREEYGMDPHAAMYRRFALAGIAAQLLLVTCAWLLPSWSRFGLVDDEISELVLGRNGWIMVIALLVGSLGAIAIAFAVRGLTRGTPGSKAGTVLLGLYGAAGLLAAIFPTNEIGPGADVWAQSLTGRIHLLAAGAGFLAAVAGVVVLAWTLTRDPRWRVLNPWPVLLATAASRCCSRRASDPGPVCCSACWSRWSPAGWSWPPSAPSSWRRTSSTGSPRRPTRTAKRSPRSPPSSTTRSGVEPGHGAARAGRPAGAGRVLHGAPVTIPS